LRLIPVLLWPVASKSGTSVLSLELLRWWLSEGVSGSLLLFLLGEGSAIWVCLAVSCRLGLLHETCRLRLEPGWLLLESRLLRVKRLLRLLLEARLLVARLLELRWGLLGHWLLVLLNGFEEVDQIRGWGLLLFRGFGLGWYRLSLSLSLSLIARGGGCEGRGLFRLDSFTSEVLSATEVKVWVVEIILEEARQVC
jgi:hypothetical protein